MMLRRLSVRLACCCVLIIGVAGVSRWFTARNRVHAGVRAEQIARTPVLVELFTSEGCSSCPPADELLGRLDREQPIRGAQVIVLSEHVDYWNHDGWNDRFSSAKLTQRQEDYQKFFNLEDVYTPQLIVAGAVQMNGSDSKAIGAALEHIAAKRQIALEIASVETRGQVVSFSLRNPASTLPVSANLYAALVDAEDTTVVRAGENGGRTLRHTGVVRSLELVRDLRSTQQAGESTFEVHADIPGRPALEGMRLVVFVQTRPIGQVLGADVCVIGHARSGAIRTCPTAKS